MFNIQPLFSKSQTNEAECNGIKYYRYFPIRISNKMTIRISFVEINSTFEQAILFLFPCDFSGNIQINGKNVLLKKGSFRKLNFWARTAPTQFEVTVSNFIGEIRICNGSDPLGNMQFCKHLSDGCAMHIENIGTNRYRMHCNDHELDLDCNDLIFDVEIRN